MGNVVRAGYVKNLQLRLKESHHIARTHLKVSSQYQKKYYDLKAKKRLFEVGQAVWLHNPVRKIGIYQKFIPKWKGPYLITKKIDDLTYLVKKSKNEPSKAYHVDRLLQYKGKKIPVWFYPQK